MSPRKVLSIFAIATAAWLGSIVLADSGAVTTNSGARYEGEINERGDDVIVTIRGVQTVINRADVASIEYAKKFEDDFKERLAKLDEKDVDGRLELARWAMQRQQYVAARDAVEGALVIDPNSADAVELQNVIRSQMRLNANKTSEKKPEITGVPSAQDNALAVRRMLLSQEDIEAMRRIEWRPDENGVRLRVDTKAAKSYAELRNKKWTDFARLSPSEQAHMILDDSESTAEQRQGVILMSDPPAVTEYRRVVQPVILNGCASSGCHGGPYTNYRLVNPVVTDEAAYTNFFLLTTYTRRLDRAIPASGIFSGATEVRMIERGNPEKSLLMQYAMPADVAEFEHPKVPNYRPIFTSFDDPRAKPMVEWIKNSLKLNPASYGIAAPIVPLPATAPSEARPPGK